MKRVGIFIFLLLGVLSLYAGSDEWKINTVTLGIGNDKYAYGFSRNDDDQLSYSGHLMIGGKRWYTLINMNGMTNRGWKTGWDIENAGIKDESADDFYNGRLDVNEIKFGLLFNWNALDALTFFIQPQTGLYLTGHLGYDLFQNLVHDISRIHHVDLPYDYSGVKFHYYLGSYAEARVDIKRIGVTMLALSLAGEASHAFGFETRESINTKLSLYDEVGEIISFSLFWRWNRERGETPTMDLFSRYINGPGFSYLIDTGIFSLYYTAMIPNHYAYCVFSFDVMGLFEPKVWLDSGIFINIGKSRMMDLSFNEFEIGYILSPNLSLVISNRFVAGYPIDKRLEEEADLGRVMRIKQGHTMNTLSLEYSFPIEASKRWVTPFVGAGAGFMSWTLTYLSNMIETYPNPSYTVGNRDGAGPDYSFVFDISGGVKIIPDGLVTFNSTSFSISINAGLSYVTGNFVSAYRKVARDKNDKWNIEEGAFWENFLLRYGFAINLGFDV